MAINRVVRPELLDGLDADDPAARRSRRDLRWINFLMGNFAWTRRALGRFPRECAAGIVEIGAGEGVLCRKLAAAFPAAPVTAIDMAPEPPGVGRVRWLRGDLFQHLQTASQTERGGVLVGGMILHHFSTERLTELGSLLAKFNVLCFCEPWRNRLSHLWGGLMFPVIGEVTRHDMPVSIDAGFCPGELPDLLGLDAWDVEESVDWRGSLRLLARRRPHAKAAKGGKAAKNGKNGRGGKTAQDGKDERV